MPIATPLLTMTELKSATGIADNRLSAHHPDGSGNETKFADFLISEIGTLNLTDTTILQRAGTGTLAPGSAPRATNSFTVVVEVYHEDLNNGTFAGRLFEESIGLEQNSLFVNQTGKCTFDGTRTVKGLRGDQLREIHFDFTVTDIGVMDVEIKLRDGLNTQARNYNTALNFSASDFVDPADVPTLSEPSYSSPGGGKLDFTWDIYDPEGDLPSSVYMQWEWDDFSGDVGAFSADPTNGPFTVTANDSVGGTDDFVVGLYDSSSKNTQFDSKTMSATSGGSGGDIWVAW